MINIACAEEYYGCKIEVGDVNAMKTFISEDKLIKNKRVYQILAIFDTPLIINDWLVIQAIRQPILHSVVCRNRR